MSDERKDPATEPEPGQERPRAKGGRPGRATRPMDPERPCMNCGDPTPGEYCPSCGQRKVDVQVSVRTLVMDVLEDQFILDKRLPRTLGALFAKPGHLTIEHINGRIVRYIHPFRLYLVSSVLFFLLLSFFSLRLVRRTIEEDARTDGVTVERPAGVDSAIATVEEALADTALDDDDREDARERLAELTELRQAQRADSLAGEVARLDSALAEVARARGDSTVPASVRRALRLSRSRIEERRSVVASQLAALEGQETAADTTISAGEEPLREVFGWGDDPPEIDMPGPPAVDSAFAHQVERLGEMTPGRAAETLTAAFFDYVPILMFVLLPVFAAVLKLLYIRRRRFYAEHFVFLLHVHSFVFLLATVMLLMQGPTLRWVQAALFGWLLIYIYIAMKRVYGQGWLKTFLKYWTLGWMYFWILSFSMVIAFMAAVLLF